MPGGELTFYSSQKERRHWCLDRLTVADRESGVVMWQMEPHPAKDQQQFCETDFPLRYGHAPPWLVTTVGPRPLSMKRVYIVEGLSGNHLRGAFSLEGATVKNVR